MFIVKINGRVLTFYKKANKKKTKNKTKKVEKNEKEFKIQKQLKRRWRSLLSSIYSPCEKSDWFITLVYPYDYSTNEIIRRIKNDLNRFGNRLRDIYQRCWFIYSFEYSNKSNIHIHLIGRVGRKKINSTSKIKIRFKDQVYKWWAKTVGSYEHGLSHVRFLKNKNMSEKRQGYLCKPGKKNNHRKLVLMFGAGSKHIKRTHGFIRKKNLPIKRLQWEVSKEDFDKKIRPVLIKDIYKTETWNNKNHKQRLKKNESGKHILNHPGVLNILLGKYGKEVRK